MNIHEFYRSIKISCNFLDKYEVLIVGSQSIHAHYQRPDSILNASHEIDIASWDEPRNHDDLIFHGEGSPFHIANKYYLDPVDIDIIILPEDFKTRLTRVCNSETDYKVGYCISPEDLAIAKLMAGREKDYKFVGRLIEINLIDIDKTIKLLDRVKNKYCSDEEFLLKKERVLSFLQPDISDTFKP